MNCIKLFKLFIDVRTESYSSMKLQLTNRQVQLLRVEVKRVQPSEACALLFGSMSSGEAVVERIVMAPNVLKSAVRFEIDPKTFYDAFTEAQRDGLDFIGLFHSHPAPAFPSSLDREFMRLWGDTLWLILSTLDNRLAAFQMLSNRVRKVTVKTGKA